MLSYSSNTVHTRQLILLKYNSRHSLVTTLSEQAGSRCALPHVWTIIPKSAVEWPVECAEFCDWRGAMRSNSPLLRRCAKGSVL